jgi:N-acetylglucosaminyl-diphospho-decaprenol L-rhamnosyltransferase
MSGVTVVIVNFNSGADALRCLHALARDPAARPRRVVVVDNGSTDGSADAIAREFRAVELRRAGRNLGFAAACNRGMADADGLVLLLNPDTEVEPGAIEHMAAALDQHPNWGIVGARMLDSRGVIYPAARRFPRPFDLFCEQLHLPRQFPHSRRFAGYLYGDCDLAALDTVDQVEGSALMISTAARTAVGELDERFFVFFEEVDWCRRVKQAGFEIHVVQTARITHHRATTMSRFFAESRRYNARSALAYFRKHHGEAGVRSLRRWIIAATYLREFAARILNLLSPRESLRLRIDGARAERAIYRQRDPEQV